MTETPTNPADGVDWGEFDSSPYIKWDNVGDTVTGVITAVTAGTDFNGNPCPVLNLTTEDDGEKILSCGQANLKAQIVGLKPKTGDTITVTFDHEEKAAMGMKKVFLVDVINF